MGQSKHWNRILNNIRIDVNSRICVQFHKMYYVALFRKSFICSTCKSHVFMFGNNPVFQLAAIIVIKSHKETKPDLISVIVRITMYYNFPVVHVLSRSLQSYHNDGSWRIYTYRQKNWSPQLMTLLKTKTSSIGPVKQLLGANLTHTYQHVFLTFSFLRFLSTSYC